MKKAGYQCKRFPGQRDYPGTPFWTNDGECVFMIPDSESICNENVVPHHRPLCYCDNEIDQGMMNKSNM